MALAILEKLAGNEREFQEGLVELGWFEFRPRLTFTPFRGKAKLSLHPRLKLAGQVKDTGAWVYQLELKTTNWHDTVAVVESHLKQEPQFAVVFCPLPNALIILVPADPQKAFNRTTSGIKVDKIYLDTKRPSNYEEEIIKKLQAAPDDKFRVRLQELPDTERVTMQFYEKFKVHLEEFNKLIEGITDLSDKDWYSSIMMNRLLFVYFLQKKGFLDGNYNYLADRLKKVQELKGKNEFQSFYRCFLLRLFHEGLGSTERSSDFGPLFGKIPFLNGGLFEVHEIESKYQDAQGKTLIDIPDEAFEKIFAFFDEYIWCLDTRPSRTEKEINPDVLGYIFEKFINQKEMGAYYTKEDITEYIAKNTIIPWIFERIKQRGNKEVGVDGNIWSLLQDEPERYIYEAVQKGSDLKLPDEIAAGCNDVNKRSEWITLAPDEYALTTEIWREVIARREHFEEVRNKLRRGEVRDIDDLITLNLDICQFVHDVIEKTEDPELIRAFWESMAGYIPQVGSNKGEVPPLTILDPTCGSGAFLFAAVKILEPLYDGCLKRMEEFVAKADQAGETRKYPDFRHILARMNDREKHPNREYFILKSIILNNLYGVDIMPEAVEICKLRLFLKMAAVVEPDPQKPNYGLEPLPDIDFNIRDGNTLVGFVSADEVRGVTADSKPEQISMFVEDSSGEQLTLLPNIKESRVYKDIIEELELVERIYDLFRRQQLELGGEVTAGHKRNLRDQLNKLTDKLNIYLAKLYNIDQVREQEKFQQWLETHKPFHWFAEFYGIMKRGGFDVIIGNPPYVEYSPQKVGYFIKDYATTTCRNLYAFILERNTKLSTDKTRSGMIVPHSAFCTDRMGPLMDLFRNNYSIWVSTYDIRPAKLFNGVDQRLAIYITSQNDRKETYSTKYFRWHENARPHLFALLKYNRATKISYENSLAKLGSSMEESILNKILAQNKINQYFTGPEIVHYHNAPRYWIRAMTFTPYFWNERDGEKMSSQIKSLNTSNKENAKIITAVLNSSLFYWWFILFSDSRHLNMREVKRFSLSIDKMKSNHKEALLDLCDQLMDDYKKYAKRKECYYRKTGKVIYDEFYPRFSKNIIDEIDKILALHYGLTDEELDFIINFDIKYRVGTNDLEEETDSDESE